MVVDIPLLPEPALRERGSCRLAAHIANAWDAGLERSPPDASDATLDPTVWISGASLAVRHPLRVGRHLKVESVHKSPPSSSVAPRAIHGVHTAISL